MRDELVSTFVEQVSSFELSSSRVAIVGGSMDEPEWKSLGLEQSRLTLFNLEATGFEREYLLDLNNDSPAPMKFDLVICNQVLEHVWNHNSFFQNLGSLVSVEGFLWISVPASNFEHGSPDYFSAGFTDKYLAKNFEAAGLAVVAQGAIASRRCYIARHTFGYWISADEARRPFRSLPIARGSGLSVATRLKKCLLLLALTIIRENRESRWAVESWVLARRTQGVFTARI